MNAVDVMNENDLHAEIKGLLPLTTAIQSWGETAYFLNPQQRLKRGVYVCTVKNKDGENDAGSRLDRDGVYRLSIGIGKPRFTELFGTPPARPAKGGCVEGPWDFTQLDKIMPHPVYGWMSWVCVLCPSHDTFQTCRPLLQSAFNKAELSAERRLRKL